MSCYPSVTWKSFTVHAAGLTWCSFGVYHDQVHYNFDSYQDFYGRCKFLTMWASYLIFFGTIIGTIVDAYKLFFERKLEAKNQSKIISFRDHFMVMWTTLGVFVPIMYWAIALFDLEGIHPESLEKQMPLFGWYNQYLHTIPVLYITVSHMFIHYQHPSLKTAIFYACIVNTAYTSSLLLIGKVNGIYVYPILNTLSSVGFFVFVFCSNVLSFLVYALIRKVDESFWKTSSEKLD